MRAIEKTCKECGEKYNYYISGNRPSKIASDDNGICPLGCRNITMVPETKYSKVFNLCAFAMLGGIFMGMFLWSTL